MVLRRNFYISRRKCKFSNTNGLKTERLQASMEFEIDSLNSTRSMQQARLQRTVLRDRVLRRPSRYLVYRCTIVRNTSGNTADIRNSPADAIRLTGLGYQWATSLLGFLALAMAP
jgi:hypothetical protein